MQTIHEPIQRKGLRLNLHLSYDLRVRIEAQMHTREAHTVTATTNREAWLIAAVEELRPMFAELGEELPTVRVSVGWPGGRGNKSATIGQCWAKCMTADSVPQLFVSPVLDDGKRVLDVLAHELVHAVDDCKSGHRGRFAKVAKGIGLTGKMTATVAGDELKAKLATIADKLGTYPHARLSNGAPITPAKPGDDPEADPEDDPTQGEPKQGTRMLKVVCPDDGYTVRTTRKWLDVGLPSCPCGATMREA